MSDIDANYQSVSQQSGILTGYGGFQIETQGKTHIKGGAITSSQLAEDQGLNGYTSLGGIITEDINNQAKYDGKSVGFSLSVSLQRPDQCRQTNQTQGSPQSQDSSNTSSDTSKARVQTSNCFGIGEVSGSQTSTTKAGITGIAGHTEITTDNQAQFTGKLESHFDGQKVQQEINAQVVIAEVFCPTDPNTETQDGF